MKLWRVDYDALSVAEVDCPDGGFPARDADGVKIFDNSHFRTEEDAWIAIERDVNSHIVMVGRAVEDARERLRKIEVEAGDAALRALKLDRIQKQPKPKE
jgi:hypothetical protein